MGIKPRISLNSDACSSTSYKSGNDADHCTVEISGGGVACCWFSCFHVNLLVSHL